MLAQRATRIKTIHVGNSSNGGIRASVGMELAGLIRLKSEAGVSLTLCKSAYANEELDMLSTQLIKKLIICVLLFVTSMPITASTEGKRSIDQQGTLPRSVDNKTEGRILWQFNTGG